MSRRSTLIAMVGALLCAAAVRSVPRSVVASGPSGPTDRVISIPVGRDATKRPASSKVLLFAALPADQHIDAVVFYVDDKEIGRGKQQPYRAEWDSTRVKEGEYAARWSALDAKGAELASGSVTLVVANKVAPPPVVRPPRRVPSPVRPERPTTSGPTPAPAAPDFVTYSSAEHAVRIDHPAGWVVKDETTSLPKGWQEGYWLIFSTDPLSSATYVVNLRHKLLQREHTAESFAKYTPYLATWEETTINGRPVFLTTAGTPDAKRVVHRVMILDGRHLWMMNCIDTSGKPAAQSKEIFMRMVKSLAPAPSALFRAPMRGSGSVRES